MIIKLALPVLSFVVMITIVLSFGKFKKDWLIYYLTFEMVIGQALFPFWFFQGMERIKALLNISVKTLRRFTNEETSFAHYY